MTNSRLLPRGIAALIALAGLAVAQEGTGHAVFSGHAWNSTSADPGFGSAYGRDEQAWPQTQMDGGSQSQVTQVQYPLDDQSYEASAGNTGWSAAAPPSADPWIRYTKNTAELTWVLPGDAPDALGITTLELRNKVEFPRAPFLAIVPRAGVHLLNGPEVSDLPSRLYDGSVEAIVSLPVGEGVFMQAAVSPSIFTDGETTSGSFRIPGRLLFFFQCGEDLTLATGAVYLDREDLSFLPAVGAIYKPSDDVKVELMIPRPRLAWRYACSGGVESWAYLVGELGGGSWAVQRANGADDVATVGDYRLLAGWERIAEGSAALRAEAGYVFNRTLEYTSAPNEISLAGTGLVRIGLTY